MNFTEQNVDFILNQLQKQKLVINNIDTIKEGKIFTILGENGSGKTNLLSVTSPYYRTLYINFESSGSANMAKILGEIGLIEYIEDKDLKGNLFTIIKEKIVEREKKGEPTIKVIVIDSFREMLNKMLKNCPISKDPKQYNSSISTYCSHEIIPFLQNGYKCLTSKGITIIQTCGINEPNDKGELSIESIQLSIKVMKEFIKNWSNAIYMVDNIKRLDKFSLCKDNIGLIDNNLEKFFENRRMIFSSRGNSPKEFGYQSGELVAYGVTNILSTHSNSNQGFIEKFKEKMNHEMIKDYL